MSETTGRLLPLDVLRAVAILLVLGFHMPVRPASAGLLVNGPLLLWRRCGWMGVDLFFVLSGFLVSGLLFREHRQFGEIRFSRFFVRRGLKIYPAFYTLLALTILVKTATSGFPSADKVLSEAFFVQNYFFRLWSHTWSLAVEEHFYLLTPLLLIGLSRWQGKDAPAFTALPRLCLAVGVTLFGLRLLNARLRPFTIPTHFYPTHLRIDSLLFGVVLSYYYHYHQERFLRFCLRWKRWLTVVGLAFLCPPLMLRFDSPFIYTAGFTLAYLGSGMLLSVVLAGVFPRSLPMRAMGYVGSHSYSIYLWHLPVAVWGISALVWVFGRTLPPFPTVAIYVLASISLGIVMAKLVELPVVGLRDRIFPSRSRALGLLADATVPAPVPSAPLGEPTWIGGSQIGQEACAESVDLTNREGMR